MEISITEWLKLRTMKESISLAQVVVMGGYLASAWRFGGAGEVRIREARSRRSSRAGALWLRA
ncbi:hypothetical protein MASR2M78_31430 [Treponema sp.]